MALSADPELADAWLELADRVPTVTARGLIDAAFAGPGRIV
jgi:hypothetical protein